MKILNGKGSIVRTLVICGIIGLFFGASTLPIVYGTLSTNDETIQNQQNIDIAAQTIGDTTTITYHLNGFTMKTVNINNQEYSHILLEKESHTQVKGSPELPQVSRSIIIPDTGVTDIHVKDMRYQEYTNVLIAPSKGVLSRTINPDDVPYEFNTLYETDAWYPAQIASLSEPYILRDFRGQVVTMYPFQYNPVTKTLRFYTDITVEITLVNQGGVNVLKRDRPLTFLDSDFSDIYVHHFLNFGGEKYTPVSEQGKMLVITYDSFWDAMLPFVQWKNMKGTPTEMVRISTIGNNANLIKTYISNYYAAHGLTFVLLVGDAAQITTFIAVGGASDPTYSYILGGDHYPDLFVGRFSASTVAQVQTQVLRSVEYEKLPQIGGTWYQKGTGIASNEGTGDDGEYDWQHMRNIRTDLLGYTYTEVDEFYDGSHGGGDASGNPTTSMVSSALNAGRSIINYCGHGSATSWGTTGYSNSNVNALTNDNTLPFIWSVACNNGEFNNYDACFAEAWLRASHNGEPTGAIGAFMSSISQYWDEPMDAQDEMVDILKESYANNKKNTFGGLSFSGCMHMNDQYGYSGWDMTDTWHVFGDPSLQVRTNTPSSMSVQHDPVIPLGATTFTVTVAGLKDALCAISKNYVLLGSAYTDVNGLTTITFSQPIMEGPVDFVVTAYNKIPYMTTLEVGSTDVLVSGSCYYQDITPVDPVSVEIINMNTGDRWEATTNNNHYALILHAGLDINAGDPLRFTARDTDESVNVTDHIVTTTDIDTRNITRDLILDVHYRDLKDFPFYAADFDTGAAVAQMILNYLWWNQTLNPEGPPLHFPSQLILFNEFNTQGGLWISGDKMWLGLNAHTLTPIEQYGYFFNPVNSTDANVVLQSICIWVDYSMSFYNQYHPSNPWPKPGYPMHIPVAVPADGTYNHWMTIRGIHTNRSAWQSYPDFPPITVYGFWVNDPKQSGLGGNTYVTTQTFLANYFKSMTVRDKYNGKYLAIIDPPQGIPEPKYNPVNIGQTPAEFSSNEARVMRLAQNSKTSPLVKELANSVMINAARRAAGEVLKYDRSDLATLLEDANVLEKPIYTSDSCIVSFHNNGISFDVQLFTITGILKQFSIQGL
ncbi:MAG: C25 family cysteine peptidase [Methanobacteriota archaeon]